MSKEKNSKSSQDEHKLSNFDSASSGGPPGGGGGTMGKEKVKGQMERRLSLISGIALIVGTMIGESQILFTLIQPVFDAFLGLFAILVCVRIHFDKFKLACIFVNELF